MRRMMTNKQSDYVNDLSEVAQKGFKVGTYPADLYPDGIFNLETSMQTWIDNENLDFENHKIISGALIFFEFPTLYTQYGLTGGSGDLPYVSLYTTEDFEIPESISNESELKEYLIKSESSQELANFIDDGNWNLDESIISNDVAAYDFNDLGGCSFTEGQIKIDTMLICYQGEGEEITGASDPIGVDTLDVENLRVENLNTDNAKIGSIKLEGETNYTIFNDDGALTMQARESDMENIDAFISCQDNWDGDDSRHTIIIDMSEGDNGNGIVINPTLEIDHLLIVNGDLSCYGQIHGQQISASEKAQIGSLYFREKTFKIWAGSTSAGTLWYTEQYFSGGYTNIVNIYSAVGSLNDYGALNSSKTISLKDNDGNEYYDTLNNLEIYCIVNDTLVNKMVWDTSTHKFILATGETWTTLGSYPKIMLVSKGPSKIAKVE